jgi:spermidine synthase
MDALQYVFHEAPSREFDMVVMDIFVDAEVPAEFEDASFLEALAATLRPNGLLLYNRLYRSVGDRALTDYYFEGVFKVVFPEAYYVETEGNRVLIGRA